MGAGTLRLRRASECQEHADAETQKLRGTLSKFLPSAWLGSVGPLSPPGKKLLPLKSQNTDTREALILQTQVH